MISFEKLQTVRTIVTHDSCPDGTASAIILRDALPDAEVRFIQYGSDAHKGLVPQPGMLFCDITPPYERAQEFVEAGAIVLDHHRTARATVEAFGDNGIFADEAQEPGVCGAVLAYRHVWKPMMPDVRLRSMEPFIDRFAILAGIRDTWQRQDARWSEACAQASVLNFIPNAQWMAKGLVNIRAEWESNYGPLGRLLVEKSNEDVVRMAQKGWHFTTAKGTRVMVIPSKGLTSDVAEYMGDKVDLIAGFGYTFEPEQGTPTLILSTRSHTTFDCATFCKAHGGGGHTKAAGCSFPVTPEMLNPYTFIHQLLFPH